MLVIEVGQAIGSFEAFPSLHLGIVKCVTHLVNQDAARASAS